MTSSFDPTDPGEAERGVARAASRGTLARPFRVIGTRVAKLDAVEKVTGAVQYLPDIEVPGMVWGRILRTRVPHARITRIDTSRAEALPGVLGVVTGRNVDQRPFGYAKDHLALKGDVVRCIRDEVAAVAAETEEIAAAACRLIDVDYEELPAVFDPRDALRPDAPRIHAQFPGNLVNFAYKFTAGDVDRAFREADAVVEGTYRLNYVTTACLGTMAAIAQWDPRGGLTMWSTGSSSSESRPYEASTRPRSGSRGISGAGGGSGRPELGFGNRQERPSKAE